MNMLALLCVLLSFVLLAAAAGCSDVGTSAVTGGSTVTCSTGSCGTSAAPFHTDTVSAGKEISIITNPAFASPFDDFYKVTVNPGTGPDLALVITCTAGAGGGAHVLGVTVGGNTYTQSCTGSAGSGQSAGVSSGDEVLEVSAFAGTIASYSIQFCTSAAVAEIVGDPHFVGFYGQKFDFQGQAGGSYNLYSDNVISLSTTFNSVPKKFGTFMMAYGLLLGPTSVSWQYDASTEDKAKWASAAHKDHSFVPALTSPLTVTINGTQNTLTQNGILHVGCAVLARNDTKLSLKYGGYTFTTVLRSAPFGLNEAIRIPYFDLESFSVPSQPRILRQGGLLGFTLVPSWPRAEEDILEEAFTVPSILSTSCSACKTPVSHTCSTPTTGRSASVGVQAL